MKWAINSLKLTRAIAKAKLLQKETEEDIKEIYASLGGKIVEEPKKQFKPKNTKPKNG